MSIFHYLVHFEAEHENTASLAKQISNYFSHEHTNRNGPNLPLLQLQQELIAVIQNMSQVLINQVKVELSVVANC